MASDSVSPSLFDCFIELNFEDLGIEKIKMGEVKRRKLH